VAEIKYSEFIKLRTNELTGGIAAGLPLFEDSDILKADFPVHLPDNVLIPSTTTEESNDDDEEYDLPVV
jgi:hypothetical protein